MERYSDTVTEVDCFFVVDVPPTEHWSDRANRALRSCKRLEVLTYASPFAVDAWLGLSQLHTLGGVNLKMVSFAVIAASLPRLHTLDAFTSGDTCPSSAAAEFFADLLPRLRSFRFTGCWPGQARTAATTSLNATATPPLQDLPLLRELVLNCGDAGLDPDVARGFLGAEPVVLRLPDTLLHALLGNVDGLPTASSTTDAGTRVVTRADFLCRVRNLTLLTSTYGPCVCPSGLARVLRAAPRLQALTATRVEDDFLFAARPPEELVHPLLRSVDVLWSLGTSKRLRSDSVARLRRLCFPRLRQLTVGGQSRDVYQ
jgi:hypothetical protein